MDPLNQYTASEIDLFSLSSYNVETGGYNNMNRTNQTGPDRFTKNNAIEQKEPSIKKLLLYLLLTALIMLFIFIQSALPANLSEKESGLITMVLSEYFKKDPSLVSFIVRKCAHFTEYTLLGISLLFTIREYFRLQQAGKLFKKRTAATTWCIGTMYAISDEFHQIFTPGRSCEVRDVLIDSLGILTGIVLSMVLVYFMKRIHEKKAFA